MLAEWEKLLGQHPDSKYREYVLAGLQRGFRIGHRYHSHANESAKANMKSAMDNPGVVDQYLAKEVGLERVIGPLEQAALPSATTSSFGVFTEVCVSGPGSPNPHGTGPKSRNGKI